ncbi:NUDIX domain-containing protein [Paraburkholderia sp. JHI869]|uniref:nucleotide triphosphate diphosphatase NUDT15 n=1 Tax=Paraburkholderia sp. JHI869 TaxID=3112959 RepID=UPI00316CF66A
MSVSRTVLGVGVVVRNGDAWLLGLRKSTWGRDTWAFPGGKVDPGEDPLAAAARELREETGLKLVEAQSAGWASGWLEAGRVRHVTLFVEAAAPGEPVVAEPDKCARWAWFTRDALPADLFEPTRLYFETRFEAR